MFKKILIANRGEIAVRIIKTCKKLGIKTVAVYSEADKESTHVRLADESCFIEESQVAKSYLSIDKIINACKSLNVDAVHPGYGFLSENVDFANKCKENGIVFIGPSPYSMEKMSLKIESRNLAQSVNVPIIPGSSKINNLDELKQEANKIGFPLLIKASAGGGGIGMEIVKSFDMLEKSFKLAQSRAKAYFGNSDVYIEKYINEPRHIEVQVLGDVYGNYIHLGERECSIQRRHQKIIEESPSIFLDDKTKQEMYECALRLSKAVEYYNAGTIEFVVNSKTKEFFFLEMNTRLQVEHPVTEMITGIDLVEQQIRIANNEKLSLSQKDIKFKGNSIECRLYAEDPITFMPSPGKINKLEIPEIENLRIDTYIYEKLTITPYYDPLLAKVISWGETRNDAMDILIEGLSKIKIDGIKTNKELLLKILNNENFRKAEITTDFIQKNL